MTTKKKILAISGSTRENSSNLSLLKFIASLRKGTYDVTIFNDLDKLPHFNPDRDNENPPIEITKFREQISKADALIICTPEYVFSLPGSLKNAIEWCVSTTIFSQKPVGLITAAASGEKGHEELKLVMKTIEATFNEETTILIKGIKGKIDKDGNLKDDETLKHINSFLHSFDQLLTSSK